MTVTASIIFKNEGALVEWFQEARRSGLIPEVCGLREQDALDPGGRPAAGSHIITAQPGAGPWIVTPVGREKEEGSSQ